MVCNELGLSLSYIFFGDGASMFFFHLKIGQYIHYMICMWCASLLIFTIYKIIYMIALHTYIYIFTYTSQYYFSVVSNHTFYSDASGSQKHLPNPIAVAFETRRIQHTERIQENWNQKRMETHRGHHHLLVHRFPCLAADSTRCFFSLRQWKCQCTAEAQSGGDLGDFPFGREQKRVERVFFFLLLLLEIQWRRGYGPGIISYLLEYSIWSLYIFIYIDCPL